MSKPRLGARFAICIYLVLISVTLLVGTFVYYWDRSYLIRFPNTAVMVFFAIAPACVAWVISKPLRQKTGSDNEVIELHGDEARDIPVPPREKLAAHPKVKTKREQLDEETGERDENQSSEG